MNENGATVGLECFPSPSSPVVQGLCEEFAEMFGDIHVRICGPTALMLGGFVAIIPGVHVAAASPPSNAAEHVRVLIENDKTVTLHARRLSDTLWISTGERALLETAEHPRSKTDAEYVLRALQVSRFDTDILRQASGDLGHSKGWDRLCHSISTAPWGKTQEIASAGVRDSLWEEWTRKAVSMINAK